jgi:signal transduction histidine kinase
MSKGSTQSLLCARSASLTGFRFILVFLASLATSPAVAADDDSASGELVGFVRGAAALIEQEGEAAFPKFREPGGKWFHGDDYVFVWGLDGMRHVYPPDPSGEGENMRQLRDVKGKPIGEWFIARAAGPGHEGWVHYQWPRPGEIFPVWKSTYVQGAVAPSGKAYVVGAGRYHMPLEPAFVIALVDEACRMLETEGRQGFARLKDETGEFVFMDTYVFVVALDGTEHVNPAFPSLEGRNLLDYKDAAGNFLVRQMIEKTRKTGNAWVAYYWPRPGSAEQVAKRAYVRRVRVDGEMLIVGAGLYAGPAPRN